MKARMGTFSDEETLAARESGTSIAALAVMEGVTANAIYTRMARAKRARKAAKKPAKKPAVLKDAGTATLKVSGGESFAELLGPDPFKGLHDAIDRLEQAEARR